MNKIRINFEIDSLEHFRENKYKLNMETFLQKLYNKFILEKTSLVMCSGIFKVTKYPGTALERMKYKSKVIFRKEWDEIKNIDEDTAEFLYKSNISEDGYINFLNEKYNLNITN